MQNAMKLRSRAAVAATVLATAFAGALLPATSADACDSGALCAYIDHNYGGNRYQFFGTNSSWSSWAIFNADSSWYNKGTTGASVRIYDEEGYGGWSRCYDQNTGERFSYATDDDGESNLWVSGC